MQGKRLDEEINELIDDDDAPTGETPRVTKLQNSKSKEKAHSLREGDTYEEHIIR